MIIYKNMDIKNKRVMLLAIDDNYNPGIYQLLGSLELYTSRVGYLPEYIVMRDRALENFLNRLVEKLDKPNFLGIPIITTTELTKLLTKKTK
jgi:hypothetical protein